MRELTTWAKVRGQIAAGIRGNRHYELYLNLYPGAGGEPGARAGKSGVALRHRPPASAEDLGAEEEHATIRYRRADVLSQRPHPPVCVGVDACGLGQNVGWWVFVHQQGCFARFLNSIQRALREHVVGGDEQEGWLAPQRPLRRSQGGSISRVPIVGDDRLHLSGRRPLGDRSDRAGVVPDHDNDPFDTSSDERANGSFDEGKSAQANQRLRASAGHGPKAFGPAGGKDDRGPGPGKATPYPRGLPPLVDLDHIGGSGDREV